MCPDTGPWPDCSGHPDHPFEAVISGRIRDSFVERPDRLYLGETICVKGRISLGGTARIVVTAVAEVAGPAVADRLLSRCPDATVAVAHSSSPFCTYPVTVCTYPVTGILKWRDYN